MKTLRGEHVLDIDPVLDCRRNKTGQHNGRDLAIQSRTNCSFERVALFQENPDSLLTRQRISKLLL